ncbi:hypothetical protein AB1Y20_000895 [Prymnesium parvum]|uniref:Uncharacterized protein n=1 Tax=Prymnesium parvum TaxID=97485 RepID=A0AB34K643_PRYPA
MLSSTSRRRNGFSMRGALGEPSGPKAKRALSSGEHLLHLAARSPCDMSTVANDKVSLPPLKQSPSFSPRPSHTPAHSLVGGSPKTGLILSRPRPEIAGVLHARRHSGAAAPRDPSRLTATLAPLPLPRAEQLRSSAANDQMPPRGMQPHAAIPVGQTSPLLPMRQPSTSAADALQPSPRDAMALLSPRGHHSRPGSSSKLLPAIGTPIAATAPEQGAPTSLQSAPASLEAALVKRGEPTAACISPSQTAPPRPIAPPLHSSPVPPPPAAPLHAPRPMTTRSVMNSAAATPSDLSQLAVQFWLGIEHAFCPQDDAQWLAIKQVVLSC